MKEFAIFDIDGTLYDSHLGVEFLREMSRLDAITGVSQELFARQYQEWKSVVDRTAYYDEHFDKYYDINLKGVGHPLFKEAARKVAQHAFPHFFPEILAELEKHRKEGRFIILISKSPEQAVMEISRLLNADAYWGWEFNFDENQKYVNQFTYSNGESDKAFITQGLMKKHELLLTNSYAYGDSKGDISMLELVSHPTAVNPEPILLSESTKRNWRVMNTTPRIVLSRTGREAEYSAWWIEQEKIRNDEFLSMDGVSFFVAHDVFSPNIATTNSVDLLLRHFPDVEGKRFLEIGTGCGVFALKAALEGASRVVATELQPAALANAKKNVADAKQENVIEILDNEHFEEITGVFDVILMNIIFSEGPKDTEHVEAIGQRSLELHRRLLSALPQMLSEGGKVLLGFGSFGDTETLQELLNNSEFDVQCVSEEKFGVNWYAITLSRKE